MALPSPSQVAAWDTEHLEAAATYWTATAVRWEDAYTAVNVASAAPGGRPWDGAAADEAFTRTYTDRMLVLGLVDALHRAAGVARTGATEIKVAQTRVLSTVQTVGRAGFDIDDDLSVWDTRPVTSPAVRVARNMQGLSLASDIRTQTADLVATEQAVASKLNAIGAGLQGFPFPEAPPLPTEPPPPQIPLPPY